jgi:hypothetical protein
MHPRSKRIVILTSVAILTIAVLAVFLVPTALASDAFPDVPDSHWAHDFISWLFNNGITSGFPDGTYRPDNNVTRAEMAVFVQQVAGAGSAGPVTDADKLDGLDSTAFLQGGTIVTTTGGTAWLSHNSAPSTVNRWISGTEFSGDGSVVLSLTAPTEFDGVAYGLKEFELCHIVVSPGFVDSVSVYRTNAGSTSATLLLSDGTNQTTTGCTTYAVNRAPGAGIGIFASLNGGGTVRLEGVSATWTTDADITSPADAAEESGGENG